MRRLINWIVCQGVDHTAPVLYKMGGVATQPAKHEYLIC